MSIFISLWEVRTLITDVLRVANELDEMRHRNCMPTCIASGIVCIRRSRALTGRRPRTRSGLGRSRGPKSITPADFRHSTQRCGASLPFFCKPRELLHALFNIEVSGLMIPQEREDVS